MKMKTYFLYSGVAFCVIAILAFPSSSPKAQAYEGDTLNMIDASGYRQGYWKVCAAMLKLEGFPKPTATVTEGRYIDGKCEGVWIEYYPTGTKKAERSYKNDKLNGVSKLFYETGNVMSETSYLNGLPEGISKSYYPDLKLWTEYTWTNGRLNGEAKTYYPNGKLCETGTWVHNWWSGEYKLYYDNWNLCKSETKPLVY